MGIITNAVSIIIGVLVGNIVKKKISVKKFAVFGISVSIISLVSFIENIFQVQNQALKGEHLYVLIFSLVGGYFIGDTLHLERLVDAKSLKGKRNQAFSEASIFFIVGGLQISGPILLGVSANNSLLYLKSVIDFPFAIMFGTLYGKGSALSALPVALIQLVIAIISYLAGEIITEQMLAQLCSVGYVILFFSGINMLLDENKKISTVNMLPSIPVVIITNLVISLINS